MRRGLRFRAFLAVCVLLDLRWSIHHWDVIKREWSGVYIGR